MVNIVYAEETKENNIYWGINDEILYLSPTEQGYATQIDTKDAAWKSSDDLYIELYCDWSNYSDLIKKVEILTDGDKKIKPITTIFWFYDFVNCELISGLDNLDTADLVDCSSMFYNCSSLNELDLHGFNTRKVEYFTNMFNGCSKLKELDVSEINTSNAKKIDGMFAGCSNLISLDVKHFETSNVWTIAGMFDSCKLLDNLDLSSFDTSNVKYMNSLFNDCISLKRLNLLGFNTSKNENYAYMFKNCTSLIKLDLSSFDTPSLYFASSMFEGCSSLEKIIVNDNFKRHNYLRDKGKDMFLGCDNLKGQEGTKYDIGYIDSSLFCIDGGVNEPGYLTSKSHDEFNIAITNRSDIDKILDYKAIIITIFIVLIFAIVLYRFIFLK